MWKEMNVLFIVKDAKVEAIFEQKLKFIRNKWKRIEVQNNFEIYKFNKTDNIQFSK